MVSCHAGEKVKQVPSTENAVFYTGYKSTFSHIGGNADTKDHFKTVNFMRWFP